jgi:hypothetical protein
VTNYNKYDSDYSGQGVDQLKRVVDKSFNRISVDGDMSTNDTVLALANGVSGCSLTSAADLENLEAGSQELFINLHKLNDQRRMNQYFIQVNHNLEHGAYFVCWGNFFVKHVSFRVKDVGFEEFCEFFLV